MTKKKKSKEAEEAISLVISSGYKADITPKQHCPFVVILCQLYLYSMPHNRVSFFL